MYVESQQDLLEDRQEKWHQVVTWCEYPNLLKSSKVKHYTVLLMLVCVISITTGVVIVYNKYSYQVNEYSDKTNRDDSINITLTDDVEYAQRRDKRSPDSYSRMNLPDDRGYFNVYVRESCRNDRRYPFDRIRFPYVEYDRRQYPISRSWTRFSRRMPIYANPFTRDTMIYTSNRVYILPPLENRYGKLISVAELLAYGYATLLNNGALMPSRFNPTYYAHSDEYFQRGMPRFNPRTRAFMGGVRSYYRSSFQPECDYEDDDEYTNDEQAISYRENTDYPPERKRNKYYTKPKQRGSSYSEGTNTGNKPGDKSTSLDNAYVVKTGKDGKLTIVQATNANQELFVKVNNLDYTMVTANPDGTPASFTEIKAGQVVLKSTASEKAYVAKTDKDGKPTTIEAEAENQELFVKVNNLDATQVTFDGDGTPTSFTQIKAGQIVLKATASEKVYVANTDKDGKITTVEDETANEGLFLKVNKLDYTTATLNANGTPSSFTQIKAGQIVLKAAVSEKVYVANTDKDGKITTVEAESVNEGLFVKVNKFDYTTATLNDNGTPSSFTQIKAGQIVVKATASENVYVASTDKNGKITTVEAESVNEGLFVKVNNFDYTTATLNANGTPSSFTQIKAGQIVVKATASENVYVASTDENGKITGVEAEAENQELFVKVNNLDYTTATLNSNGTPTSFEQIKAGQIVVKSTASDKVYVASTDQNGKITTVEAETVNEGLFLKVNNLDATQVTFNGDGTPASFEQIKAGQIVFKDTASENVYVASTDKNGKITTVEAETVNEGLFLKVNNLDATFVTLNTNGTPASFEQIKAGQIVFKDTASEKAYVVNTDNNGKMTTTQGTAENEELFLKANKFDFTLATNNADGTPASFVEIKAAQAVIKSTVSEKTFLVSTDNNGKITTIQGTADNQDLFVKLKNLDITIVTYNANGTPASSEEIKAGLVVVKSTSKDIAYTATTDSTGTPKTVQATGANQDLCVTLKNVDVTLVTYNADGTPASTTEVQANQVVLKSIAGGNVYVANSDATGKPNIAGKSSTNVKPNQKAFSTPKDGKGAFDYYDKNGKRISGGGSQKVHTSLDGNHYLVTDRDANGNLSVVDSGKVGRKAVKTSKGA